MRSVNYTKPGVRFRRILLACCLVCPVFCLLAASAAHADSGCGQSGTFSVDNRDVTALRLITLEADYQGVFVEGASISNTFTATVDWGGKPPWRVVFSLNGTNSSVATSGSTAQIMYNMGSDLQYSLMGVKNTLVVYAVANDGSSSQPLQMSLWGLRLPDWAVSSETQLGNIGFHTDPQTGSLVFDGDVILLRNGMQGTVTVPHSIPEVGGTWGVQINPLEFGWELSVAPSGSSLNGLFDLEGAWGGFVKAGQNRNGALSAGLAGSGQFLPEFRLTNVSAELAGSFEFVFPRVPLICQWSGCCDPNTCPYFQASIAPGVAGTVAMEQGEPALIAGMKFKNGTLTLEAKLKGTVGVGNEDAWINGTGTIGGRPYVTLQFPGNAANSCSVSEYVREAGVDLLAEAVVKLAWWEREWSWEFNIYHCPGTGESYYLMTPLSENNGAVRVIDRAYLAADEGYCVFPDRPKGSVLEAIPGMPEPILNVGDLPTPSIAAGSSQGLLLFVFDDTNKPTGKHQEIYFARWAGGAWTTHAPITDNLKPDMQPVAAFDSSNTEIAAWVQMGEPNGTETGPRDILPGSEIVYSTYDPGTGTWAAEQALTNNTHADLLPWIERNDSGELRLCWLSSETNAIPVWHDEVMAPLADVMAADWSNGFGTPYMVAEDLQTASKPALARTSSDEFLAYILDVDHDASTGSDREVVVRHRTIPETWSADVQLTTDALMDSAVRIGLDGSGNPVVVWVKRMVPFMLPGGEDSSVDQLWYTRWNGSGWNAPAIAFEAKGITEPKMMRSAADKLVLFWVGTSQEFSDIYYSVLDSTAGQWGLPQQITHDEGAETMISLTETDGDILVAYVKRRVDLNDTSGVPQIGLSDLYLLDHQPARDLRVEPSTITFDPDPPIRTQNTTVCAEVTLGGDFVVADVRVDFYDGDPDGSGVLIDTDTIATLLPGESKDACVMWVVPDDGQSHEVYAVVDPLNTIPESDEFGNNQASRAVLKPDLRVTSLRYLGAPVENQVLLGVTISNIGSATAGGSVCMVRGDGGGGEVLFTASVPVLASGEVFTTQFSWDVATMDAGTYTIGADADLVDDVDESNEDNNRTTLNVPVLADLQIEQWSLAARPGLARALVKNVGAKPAAETVLRISLGGDALGETLVAAMNSGSWQEVAVSFSGADLGDQVELAVNPDSDGSDEVFLANNSATALIEIGLAPDLDLDHDVDADDLAIFESCASGPAVPHNGSDTCQSADFDGDGDVDQNDFARFQRCYSGPDNPADPACAD